MEQCLYHSQTLLHFLLYHSLVEKSFNIEQTIRNGANSVVCHKKRSEKPRTT